MRRKLTFAVLLVIAASCSPVLEPDDVAGEYVLQAVPFVVNQSDGRLEIIADTLRVSGDGTATRVVTESFTSEAGSYTVQRVEQHRYDIRGGTVEFSLICPPNALMLCTPPPHYLGTMSATGLTLRSTMVPQIELEYARAAAGVRMTS